jgi:hypothetical protein
MMWKDEGQYLKEDVEGRMIIPQRGCGRTKDNTSKRMWKDEG